jgi:two-component system sensor histidine kinase/response regulator
MMPTPLFAPIEVEKDRYHILVADDNETFRAAIRGLLGCLGHTVEVASNGREAVEAASREKFDFVFLDIQMPEMGGFEAAALLRHGGLGAAPFRIIGLSAWGGYAQASGTAVMDHFLVKPVRLDDLVGVLGRFAVR